MEISLNLLWAVLVALTLCLWAWRWRTRPDQRCGLAHGVLLLVCVLLLLFPCISISDDLHGGDMIEDPTAGGRKLRAQADALQHVLVAMLPASLPLLPSLISTRHEIVDTAFRITDADLQPSAPRSPPLA